MPEAAVTAPLPPILEALPIAILAIDGSGRVAFANHRAAASLGTQASELTGAKLDALTAILGAPVLAAYRRLGTEPHAVERAVTQRWPAQEFRGSALRLDVTIRRTAEGGAVMTLEESPARDACPADALLLTRAFEQSPFAMLIVDHDGRAVHGNPAFCHLAGAEQTELRGRCLDEAALNLGSESFVAKLQGGAGTASGKQILQEVIDGTAVSLLETLSPLTDESGQVTHFLIARQEVTEQEMTKTALARSEQRFRKVTELAGEWLWEQDSEGRYTYSSAALFTILGYRPEEIIGKSYLEILTEGDRRHWTSALPASPNIPRAFRRLVNRYRHKDGREVFTESSGEPVIGERGEILAWRGVDHDITTRKRFEDALRVRERAIEAASVGITIIDAVADDRPIIYANATLSGMVGVPKERLLRCSQTVLLGPDADPAAWRVIDAGLAEAAPVSLTTRVKRHDGASFWADLQVSPVRDGDGRVTHFIWIIADVTERQRAAETRHELEMARHIQTSLLPKAPLKSDKLEATGICIPAGAVGGDFYDYFSSKEGVSLAIADVSGHSVGAALMMSETRSALRAEIRTAGADGGRFGPAGMLSVLNELLFDDLNGADLFITMLFVDFDPITRRLRYANAGHCPGLVAKNHSQRCVTLDAEGLVLGVRPQVRFEEKSLLLKAGDVVLLYTDGVIEAIDRNGEMYGVERLCSQLLKHRLEPPDTLMQALLDDVRAFRGEDHQADDTSLLVLKVY
ncbi:PAS domain S-box protein [Methylolobus aquaticus]